MDRIEADLIRRVAELRKMPPYQAALAYRDLVRMEAPLIRLRLQDPVVRQKYDNYLKTYERPIPSRYFTDHNYAQKLIPIVELVRSGKVRSVLDAACGNGFEAVLFALFGVSVQANDCTNERYTITQTRAEFYRELVGDSFRLKASLSNIMDGDTALDRYDVVFVQEAISHIHPAEQFLALVSRRYLVPGGRLVVCDSNGWNPFLRARITRHLWAERRTVRHYLVEFTDPRTGRPFLVAEERLFGPPTMRRMLRAAGLVPERTWMSGFALPMLVRRPASSVARWVDRTSRTIPIVRAIGGLYTIVARNPEFAR